MQMMFPVGHFVDREPRMVNVDYQLPYNQVMNFMTAQEPHYDDMRNAYVVDRGRVREKIKETIPVYVFKTTFQAVSLYQFRHICFAVGKRPLTFIELLAFAQTNSMMEQFQPDKQTVTNALGSLYDAEEGDKKGKASVSLVEFPDSMRNVGPRKSIGFALLETGFGEGVFLPVTDRKE